MHPWQINMEEFLFRFLWVRGDLWLRFGLKSLAREEQFNTMTKQQGH